MRGTKRGTWGLAAAAALLVLTTGTPPAAAGAAEPNQWPAVPRQADPIGDVAPSGGYGPSFTPPGPTDRGDIAWVSATPVGADVLVQIKLKDVFVYSRSYWRSGDRRTLKVMEQGGHAVYGGVQVTFGPDASGTKLVARTTTINTAENPYGPETCPRAATVTMSRVHDLVGVLVPMDCAELYGNDTFEPGTLSVGVLTSADYVATIGTREVARSSRAWFDNNRDASR